VNDGNILDFCVSLWPGANEGHHYQHSCEMTGVKCRGVCGGGSISAQGRWD
jgi:hypothetical protein